MITIRLLQTNARTARVGGRGATVEALRAGQSGGRGRVTRCPGDRRRRSRVESTHSATCDTIGCMRTAGIRGARQNLTDSARGREEGTRGLVITDRGCPGERPAPVAGVLARPSRAFGAAFAKILPRTVRGRPRRTGIACEPVRYRRRRSRRLGGAGLSGCERPVKLSSEKLTATSRTRRSPAMIDVIVSDLALTEMRLPLAAPHHQLLTRKEASACIVKRRSCTCPHTVPSGRRRSTAAPRG